MTLLLLWSDLGVCCSYQIFSVLCEIPPCLFSHTLLSFPPSPLSSPLPPLLPPFLPPSLSLPPSFSSSLTSDATQWSSSLAQTTASAVAITTAIDGTPARRRRTRSSGVGGNHTGYGWSEHCVCRAADGQTRDIREDVSWREHERKKGRKDGRGR